MRVPSAGRRSAVLAAALACVVAVSVVPRPQAQAGPTRTAGLDDAGYLALADRLQRRLDPLWNAAMGRYEPGPGAADAQVNADLLLVHAVAARHGHRGPARQDARARSVARFLVSPALFSARPPFGADPQVKGAGWVAAPGRPLRHPVFDIEVIEALTQAYLARDALRLDGGTVARIRDEIHQVATSEDYRYPALRLNQINWYIAVLAADATVNGAHAAFVTGVHGHLEHFLAGVAPQPGAAGNLGAGLRFHYLPRRETSRRFNVDSAEYANIVLSFSRYYGAARSAGMRPPSQLPLLRDWVRRVVSGYWTHGGYLNWDTGLSFSRWHQRKKVGLAQQALIGIAAERELQPGAAWGAWAKWMLDRGLLAYDAQAAHGASPLRPPTTSTSCRAAGRSPTSRRRGPSPTRCGRCWPGSAGAPRAARPRSTPMTRTRAGWPSPRPRTTRRSSRSTSGRSRTEDSTSRACSTAIRRSRRTSAAQAARPSGCTCAAACRRSTGTAATSRASRRCD